MELTNGTLMIIIGVSAFVLIFTAWLLYLIITDKKMKKIIKTITWEEDEKR